VRWNHGSAAASSPKKEGKVKMKTCIRNPHRVSWRALAMTAVIIVIAKIAEAQDGNAGINQANTQVRSYFESGTTLMYAIGAILGLIGAIKVYSKWNSGDQDTSKVAAAWFGSCIFLVVVATIIKSFFGM
jgi:uncharacterized membrane protein YidH (DUF202 family)